MLGTYHLTDIVIVTIVLVAIVFVMLEIYVSYLNLAKTLKEISISSIKESA